MSLRRWGNLRRAFESNDTQVVTGVEGNGDRRPS